MIFPLKVPLPFGTIQRVIRSGILVLALWAGPAALAGDWPCFRGANFDGSNSEKDLPLVISKTAHIAWKTDLEGPGSSTPAVWEDAVFVTTLNKTSDAVIACKVNLSTGKIEWADTFSQAPRHDRRSDMAAPSPATDGKLVIFMSGAGDLVAYDFGGKRLWSKNLPSEFGQFALKWTYSSSPILFENVLYLQVLQRNESADDINPGRASFLLALHPETGEQKWIHNRQSNALGESLEAYSTPTPINHEGRREILIAGADGITGHHPENGTELWRWSSWNPNRATGWRTIASPVYGDDMIAVCAPQDQPVYTFFAGKSGTIPQGDVKWKSKSESLATDIPTPVYYEKFFYFLNGRKKILSCVSPFSGNVEWSEVIPSRSNFEASPTAADGKLFLISLTGEVFIYKTGPTPEFLHSTILGLDPDARNRSSIVPARGRLVIRLGNAIWCMK